MKHIGHVEILRLRVYPQYAHQPDGPEVIVKPGQYPLYRDGADVFWKMRGSVNNPWTEVEDLGRGAFTVHRGDRPSRVMVEISSPRFGPGEWADLLATPEFTEGDEEQRLRVSILEGAA